MRSFLLSLTAAAAMMAVPAIAAAQAPGPAPLLRDVSLSVGTGPLSHGDHNLGRADSIGGSMTWPIFRNLAARIDVFRNLGPEPREQACGVVNVSCTGVGHNGVRNMTVAAGGAVYYFGSETVRPFVAGGLDLFHFTSVSSVTTIRGGQATITEFAESDTTMGITVGAGLRISAGARLVITPEIRIYDGTMLAGTNLGQVRTSVAIGYRW
jgi:hypothetical protein